MFDVILHILTITVLMYGALLTAYFTTTWLYNCQERGRPDKIQRDRELSPALIKRDRRQSIKSLAFIAFQFALGDTAYTEFHWGFQALPLTPWSVILSFIASMLVFDTWFYWSHRLIHQKPFFVWVHRWHHQSVTPVAWSNNSDLIVDNLFIQSYWILAHFLLPISPYVLVAHKLYDQITGTIGHAGVEYGGTLVRPKSPFISVTHHDQHHRYFNCNYATHFTLWDRLMGTLHRDHDTELTENLRRRTLAAKRANGTDGQS